MRLPPRALHGPRHRQPVLRPDPLHEQPHLGGQPVGYEIGYPASTDISFRCDPSMNIGQATYRRLTSTARLRAGGRTSLRAPSRAASPIPICLSGGPCNPSYGLNVTGGAGGPCPRRYAAWGWTSCRSSRSSRVHARARLAPVRGLGGRLSPSSGRADSAAAGHTVCTSAARR